MNKPNAEKLPPFLPHEHEIVKEALEDGTIVYRSATNGDPLVTGVIDLCSLTHGWLEKCMDLVNLLDLDLYGKFGHILELLIRTSQLELQEVHDFLERSVGFIEVETVSRGNDFCRNGRVVGVRVKK